MPIGQTQTGPLWISLIDGDSFLISGSRRKGKSGLTHAMIQALLHGGRTHVYAWDGKGGAEYQGYIGRPNFHFISNAESGLRELTELLACRLKQLRESGYPSIILHNEAGREFIEPIALFVDEIAELDNPLKEQLKRMIKLYGACGLYPILCTNDPLQSAVLAKMNLSTRICFAVPSFQDSLTVLGMKGAEAIMDRGRGMIIWDGRLIEFQSFRVTYPEPSDEQRRILAEMTITEADPPVLDEIAQMVEQIRGIWHRGMSKRAVAKLLGVEYAGSYTTKIDKVIDRLSATTTTQTPDFNADQA
jgi:DNA segregation ATPase FtsK/SpoIIIE-like protein